MRSGQYIVITHNDAIIMNANVLYGVSMHDGVSKILSLNVNATLGDTTTIGNPVLVEVPPLPRQTTETESELIETMEEMPLDEDFAP